MQSDIDPGIQPPLPMAINSQPLRIVLYCPSFWPNVGGLEMVGQILAEGFATAGAQVTVLTKTPTDRELDRPYKIIRRPGFKTIVETIGRCDIVHCNGPSLVVTFAALLVGKPVVWTHQNYRLSSVDGLGWMDGSPAPLKPLPSSLSHLKRHGFASFTGVAILWVLRFLSHLVAANVAISHHMERRQPLPRQFLIYNPFNAAFKSNEDDARQQLQIARYQFGFLGRLVSEKGCDTLIQALALLNEGAKQGERSSLLIIGDGPDHERLQALAKQAGLNGDIAWAGSLSGEALIEAVRSAAIFVLPSFYEEPMGLVALELMSAGKPLIVSQRGGLAECTEGAADTFPNGDAKELAKAMQNLSADRELQSHMVAESLRRAQAFDSNACVNQYLDLFRSLIL